MSISGINLDSIKLKDQPHPDDAEMQICELCGDRKHRITMSFGWDGWVCKDCDGENE